MARIQLTALNFIDGKDIKLPIPTAIYIWSFLFPMVGMFFASNWNGVWFKAQLMLSLIALAAPLFGAHTMFLFLHPIAVLSSWATIVWYNHNIKFDFADASSDTNTEKLQRDVEKFSKRTEKEIQRLSNRAAKVESTTMISLENLKNQLTNLAARLTQLRNITDDLDERTLKLEGTSRTLFRDYAQRTNRRIQSSSIDEYDSDYYQTYGH
ncbi:hypothetical protein PVAG01_03121 [Phlyctema vagabunda]|uniref:Uncharacterized protein n=1 Tax=Phlyctema vagabunda TaxID=108571 RepID=A0ABR4PSM2_9HELO